jgi:transcriptional regulator with XRE-family HTH domain
MKSHEAIQRAIKGRTVEFAKRLGLSASMVNKWQEPTADWSDSGAYNPLDRLEGIAQIALDLGADRDEALAPLYWLNQRFGLHAVPDERSEGLDDLSLDLIETLREVGHLTTVASEALSSGEITVGHASKIEEEGNHLIRRVSVFMKKTKELVHKRFHSKLLFRRNKVVGE